MSPVIVIAGPHGSGKSVVAKKLAKALDFSYGGAGRIFRELAAEHNLTVSEFSELAENDYSIDKLIDAKTKKLARKGNVVLEGQLAAWMTKDLSDLKIFLSASLEVRVGRIAKREKLELTKAYTETKIREISEQNRFKTLYQIDVGDRSIYDLIINTEKWTAEQICQILKKAVNNMASKRKNEVDCK
ncbi:MAG: (d)CMP kinase [Candidatus Kariarchaeaceae archaeon]